LHTTDGGKVWEIVPIPTQPDTFVVIMDNMFFLNNEKGWVSGLNASDSPFTGLPIYYTSDGGSLWEARAHFSTRIIESIFFIDEYRGWAGSNGAIYYSLNGGNTWNIHYEDGGERFLDICFVNADLGWALSMRGNIYQYSCQ